MFICYASVRPRAIAHAHEQTGALSHKAIIVKFIKKKIMTSTTVSAKSTFNLSQSLAVEKM